MCAVLKCTAVGHMRCGIWLMQLTLHSPLSLRMFLKKWCLGLDGALWGPHHTEATPSLGLHKPSVLAHAALALLSGTERSWQEPWPQAPVTLSPVTPSRFSLFQ